MNGEDVASIWDILLGMVLGAGVTAAFLFCIYRVTMYVHRRRNH